MENRRNSARFSRRIGQESTRIELFFARNLAMEPMQPRLSAGPVVIICLGDSCFVRRRAHKITGVSPRRNLKDICVRKTFSKRVVNATCRSRVECGISTPKLAQESGTHEVLVKPGANKRRFSSCSSPSWCDGYRDIIATPKPGMAAQSCVRSSSIFRSLFTSLF